TQAVSDVYQDVFGEGSFIGKGIYDVDMFLRSLAGRLPDNLILSHDLLEGCYARSGIVSDVQFFEESPSSYALDENRRHRWRRGDWQIAAWLLPGVPSPTGWRKNPISTLSKWKIFDNMRRSLVPIAMTILFVAGWTALGNAVFWTMFGVGLILVPKLAISAADLFKKPGESTLASHLAGEAVNAVKRLVRALFVIITLPCDAFLSMDAITRALIRMLITRRKALEWVTSSEMKRLAHTSLAGFYLSMWVAPVLAAVTMACVRLRGPEAFPAAAAFLVMWILSPAAAWRLSQTFPERKAKLTREEDIFLRNTARRTWRFFEQFVDQENNWLPPDNFQEAPVISTARRTSPTNIGMALLSGLVAYDFCYMSAAQFLERTSNTLGTMKKLERFRGNFFNWYNTETLETMPPHYISSVDSGNLAGSLLVLKQGLLEISSAWVIPAGLMKGIQDTVNLLNEEVKKAGKVSPEIVEAVKEIVIEVSEGKSTGREIRDSLAAVTALLDGISDLIWAERKGDFKWWAAALKKQCTAWIEEIDILLPWTGMEPPRDPRPGGLPGEEEAFREFIDEIEKMKLFSSLRDIAGMDTGRVKELAVRLSGERPDRGRKSSQKGLWPKKFISSIERAARHAAERIAGSERLALESGELADMEFDFLYDKAYNLLAIGYNVSERRQDGSCYDLLASESRLASFIGIALGRLPQEHWFALGRLLTSTRGGPALLSWGGSMFEYLMPLLVMPTYDSTLLDGTYKAIVAKQIEYASRRGVPWGISESGYYTTDAHMNYQYRAFGVPDLGFKRGLADDLVIAPYASVMALMVYPRRACSNLARIRNEGGMGKYGFYEAIDHTPSHLPHGKQESAIVRSFMAHHQGMSFLSLAYVLLGRPMQRRFLADPVFQSAELLLHERVPKSTPFHPHANEPFGEIRKQGEKEAFFRVFTTPHTRVPEVHLLSNGRYNVMITNSGGGSTRWKDLAVSRWKGDTTRDDDGSFCYIRDADTGEVWSAGYRPAMKMPERYEAIFSMGKAEFRRRDKEVDTHTQIAVSPEDDIELRRINITNGSRDRKTMELTSYSEVVLAPHEADAMHPAFSKLFVRTEIVREKQAILCSRRKRSADDAMPYMFHLVAIHATAEGDVSYETDRARFIGRGRDLSTAEAMQAPTRLSNTEGAVLDPAASIRCRVVVEPEQSATVDFVTGMAETREKAMEFIEKYRDRHLADRVFDLAWTHAQVVLQQSNATEADAQLFGRLAGSIIYPNSLRRASSSIIMKNRRGQSGLWGYSISGDLPMVLVRIADQANIDLVRQMLKAHTYWRMKGLTVDLVIWNEDHSGYRQILQDKIMGLVTGGTEAHFLDRPGGIFIRRPEQISDEDKVLFQTVARVIISDTRGSLSEQIDRRGIAELNVPQILPVRSQSFQPREPYVQPRRDLVFFNGIGGFTPDGREYVINITRNTVTPAPWVNVIANPFFGTVVSESGGAYTWRENAGQFRLTPWYNDPVSDLSGEAFYIRDEESGRFWSPSPMPARGTTPYVIRHGCGYTVFEHFEEGIESELWVYVAMDAAVKYSVLKLRNASGRERKLSVTSYVEPVLGEMRSKTGMHIVTEMDPKTGALFMRNHYSADFGEYTAFLDVNETARTITGDRAEFLGRNGSLARPAAMSRARLSNRSGAGFDPCAAIQARIGLAEGQGKEVVFTLGAGRNDDEARDIINRYRGAGEARENLGKVWNHWNHVLGAVYVETPTPSINVMTNSWLLYQTIACRTWARAAYYQAGGAFGFRDQLQDAMALVHAEPGLLREQLIRASSRQFEEGDVQHWWHEPGGAGVRTRFSDDLMWLPFAAARYVKATGDTGVLDEKVNFLKGRTLKAEEDAHYDRPGRSEESATVYEHCVRALKKGITSGKHGLPLMGTGDWNDGMNLVGAGGQGESVWLAFFLYCVISEFLEIARIRNDGPFSGICAREMKRLASNVDEAAWDGKWYLRAFFDNGAPLGSSANEECQIDSIPQSWAVISRAGDKRHARTAMEEVYRRLVRKDESLIQLFDPPFDASNLEPGYIKGYLPGVRENGGQYTHAAVWVVIAFVLMGDHERAWELFNLINPVEHGSNARDISVYKVEPYVVSADIYAVHPHMGRGGWTWYTGSAGWMYRLIIEYLLGITLENCKLRLKPCMPEEWKGFVVHYRFRETVYHMHFDRTGPSQEVRSVKVDGSAAQDLLVHLVDDRCEHDVKIEIGGASGKI
ncbi:MAG: glucoamylase family protein, partial [Candidatus Omnitrophota bacterium]